MRKRLQTTIYVCLTLLSSVYAQYPSITFGESKVKIDNGNYDITLCPPIPEDDEYTYSRVLQGMGNSEIVVEKIRKKTGEKIWQKTLPFKQYELLKGTQLIKIDTIENNYIVFIKQNNSKTKKKILTAQLMDKNMELTGMERIVATTPTSEDKNFGTFLIQRKGDFFIIHSSSQSTAGLSDRNIPSTFTIIDTQMNPIWTKDILLPKDHFFQPAAATLDSNQNLIAVYKSSFEKDNLDNENLESPIRVYRTVETKYEIFTYNYRNNNLSTQTVSLSSHFKFFGDDCALIDSTTNTIKLFGQYNKQKPGKGFEGVYLLEFDLNTMVVTQTKIIPFTQQVIAQFLDAKKAVNGHLPEHYFIRNAFRSDDGEYYFIFEEFIGNTHLYPASGPSLSISNSNGSTFTISKGSDISSYAYGNLIICHSASDTEMGWSKKVPRKSEYSSPKNLRHYSFMANNIVYVMFNATSKSVMAFETDQEYKFKNSLKDNILMVIGFNQNGKMISNNAFAYEKDRNYTWLPEKTKQRSQTSIEVTFSGPQAAYIDSGTTLKGAVITIE